MASLLLFRKQIATVVGRNHPMAGIQKAALSGGMHQLPAAGGWGTSLGPQGPSPSLVSPPGSVPIPRRLGPVSKVSACWVTHLQVSTLGTRALKAQHISLLAAQALLQWLCAIAKVTPDSRLGWACALLKEKKAKRSNKTQLCATVWQSPGCVCWTVIPWGLNWVGLLHSQVDVTGSGADEACCVHGFFCNSYLTVKLPNVRHEQTVVLQARAVWALVKKCRHCFSTLWNHSPYRKLSWNSWVSIIFNNDLTA